MFYKKTSLTTLRSEREFGLLLTSVWLWYFFNDGSKTVTENWVIEVLSVGIILDYGFEKNIKNVRMIIDIEKLTSESQILSFTKYTRPFNLHPE